MLHDDTVEAAGASGGGESVGVGNAEQLQLVHYDVRRRRAWRPRQREMCDGYDRRTVVAKNPLDWILLLVVVAGRREVRRAFRLGRRGRRADAVRDVLLNRTVTDADR